MDLSTLRRDPKAAAEGVDFPFGTAKIRIASWMNKNQAKYLADIQKTHGMRIKNKSMTDEEAGALHAGQWQYVITYWEGIQIDGVDVPWSPAVVKELAQDERYEDFFEKIVKISQDEMNYREETLKAAGEK